MTPPLTLCTRQDQEQNEYNTLAPYAAFSGQSLGRQHPEQEHDFRTGYQRDRDRIIHCVAFRRLEYKTQVFLFHEGDHYRTRLTHTLEVAQIARTLARILRVNQDLTEAHALAHDIGHPPFGHAGERDLNRLMAEHGGFEHNAQALRIVDLLERRYPEFQGLNLTAETRRCILKTKKPFAGMGQGVAERLPIEAQIVDIADEISYSSHDLDDGIESGYLHIDDLKEVPLWREGYEQTVSDYPGLDEKRLRFHIIIHLINSQVLDVANEALRRLQRNDGHPTDETVDYSPEMKKKVTEVQLFLRDHLYRHPIVMRMTSRCSTIICHLFERYCEHPFLLPKSFAARVETDGIHRTVADYISGMTDRFAEQDYRHLFGF